jgi:hypothetical protein
MSEDSSPTPFSLTLNASDAEGDTLTWSISSVASNGTASASGTGTSKAISYTPSGNYNGADSFIVQVSDGTDTDTITVNVTIDSVNDSPLIITTAPSSAYETFTYSYQANVIDPEENNDGSSLLWSLSGYPSGMTISPFGLITWTPSIGTTTSGTVTLSVSDGTSSNNENFIVSVTEARLEFTPDNWNIAQTLSVNAFSNFRAGDYSGNIKVAVVDSESDDDFDAVVDASLTVAVSSDDTGLFTLSHNSLTVNEDSGSNTFTVKLGTQPYFDVQINVTSSDTSEAIVSPATLLFSSGNWNTAQTITITGNNDALLTTDTATITLSIVDGSSDDNFDALSDQSVSVTCTNDDSASFTLSKTTSTLAENGGTDTFTVVLGAQPISNVVFDIVSSATGEATVDLANLTFTNANWNIPQTVTITGVNDNTLDTDTSTVTISVNDAGSDDNFDALANQTVAITCTNDDSASFSVSKTASTVVENGGTDTFTVVLGIPPTSDVVFDIVSSATGEATVDLASLTFTNGNWSTPQTVTITGIDDSVFTNDSATITISVIDASSDDDFDSLANQTLSVSCTNNDKSSMYLAGDGSGGGGSGDYFTDYTRYARGGNGGGDNDTLTGSFENDVIFGDGSGGGGGGEPYRVSPGGSAGAGVDTIYGGLGNDIIFGDGFNGDSGSSDQHGAHGGFGGGGGGGGATSPSNGNGGNGGLFAGGGGSQSGTTEGTSLFGGFSGGPASKPVGGSAQTDQRWGGNAAMPLNLGTAYMITPSLGGSGYNSYGAGGGAGFGGLNTQSQNIASGVPQYANGGYGQGADGYAGTTDKVAWDDDGSLYTYVFSQLSSIFSSTQGTTSGVGNGADTIDGQGGDDDLFGLGGNDIFVFEVTDSSGSSTDTVWDFNRLSETDILRITINGSLINTTQRDSIISAQSTNGSDRTLVFTSGSDTINIIIKNINRDLTSADFE